MRIYAVADIHGKTEKIDIIKSIISHEKPDLLVIAGDITNYVCGVKTVAQLKELPVPVFCVRGNSDFKYIEKILQGQKNITLLNHKPLVFKAAGFLGLNGTIPLPLLSKISFWERRTLAHLKNGVTPETILVAHPPPRGVCDKVGNKLSAGSFVLKRFIENHSPLMVLCGHIHEQAGYQFLNKTLVVNCAMNKKINGAIIDYDNHMTLKVKMIGNDNYINKGR
ncbi:MAG: metallophosphoesterase [Proteobacteria bacterium]|nr:metallophosphoesterase [Pseudomonadota bacterium]MBU1582500.1 metallophosphoesterase [Pseudomonadota bacterium]MBU2629694.1 metallophosphoesterase [Pseudomonadota bacterium]